MGFVGSIACNAKFVLPYSLAADLSQVPQKGSIVVAGNLVVEETTASSSWLIRSVFGFPRGAAGSNSRDVTVVHPPRFAGAEALH